MLHNGFMEVRPWKTGLTGRELDVIEACLRAAAVGPFFPDWEFVLLFDMERGDLRSILAEWPEGGDPEAQWYAVNGALNNLLGYPHGRDDVWEQYVPVSRQELRALFDVIREASGANDLMRQELADDLADVSVLSEAELDARASLVRSTVRAAHRYGLAVPDRLDRHVARSHRRASDEPSIWKHSR
jgi:hypothetical protein